MVFVNFWTPNGTAKGKLHSVRATMSVVPNSLRLYLGVCEIGSALGPVV